MILWEKDGAGLEVHEGTLWLFVRDCTGKHSTSLTDETRHELRRLLGFGAEHLDKDLVLALTRRKTV